MAPKENQKGRRCPEGMKAPVGLLSRRPVCEANAACSARQGHGDFDALEPGGDCSLLAPKENQKGRRCPEGMKAPVGLLSRRPVCEANAACLARQGHGDFDALQPGGVCSLLAPKENQKSASDFDALDPRIKGCSPLIIPKQRSKRKNASRFAKSIFRASPISRPLSRCGGSSPQGSGSALSVTFGDTSPKGRGKKHSQYALGTLSKKRQETCPPRSWLSLRESWREAPERVGFPPGCLFSPLTRMLPQGASGSRCRLPLRPHP